eukprot:GEMP01093777.1.p1 GENE.GEMP01093777.1~~GEMP01093777.1.p1  ORF type:complete len:216 (+),score=14.78 GEMP01093777.1:24-650(+)
MSNVVLLSNAGNSVQKDIIRKDLHFTLHPNPNTTTPGGEWFKVEAWSKFDSYQGDKPLTRTSMNFTQPRTSRSVLKVLGRALQDPNGPQKRLVPEPRTFQPLDYQESTCAKHRTSRWCLCPECKAKFFLFNYRYGRGAVNPMNNNSFDIMHNFHRSDTFEARNNLHHVGSFPGSLTQSRTHSRSESEGRGVRHNGNYIRRHVLSKQKI